MANAITTPVSPATAPTMTSLELVEFINSDRSQQAEQAGVDFPSKGFAALRHDSFMTKVPDVLGGGVQNFLDTHLNPQNGRTYFIYRFPKREACLMAMSYSYDLQAKVFDRMTALESATAAAALPDFSDPVAAARAWADAKEAERRIAAEKAAADAELTTARPKAIACDILSESKGDRCIRDAAKDLQVPERKLIEVMITKGWLFRTPRTDGGTGELRPAALMVSRQFAKMVPVHTDAEKTKTRDTLRITNAGLTRIAALLVKWGLKKASNDAVAKVAA